MWESLLFGQGENKQENGKSDLKVKVYDITFRLHGDYKKLLLAGFLRCLCDNCVFSGLC